MGRSAGRPDELNKTAYDVAYLRGDFLVVL